MKTTLLFISALFLLLFLPEINFAQSQQLASLNGYALFTSTGTIVNNGPTIVRGDMGSNTGNFTGFPPGLVMGQTLMNNPATAQAALDLNILNTTLSLSTCDTTINSMLGNNQFLTPKVYCLGNNALLDGNLILDGGGNPNARFIFKVNGDFFTNKYANVILLNGASLDNIYWHITGNFQLGDSSSFMGNIVSTGNISFLQGASIFGRVLSLGDTISLNNNFVTTGLSLSPLAIKISGIQAINKDLANSINWTSETEDNGDVFEIERSSDGNVFMVINTIPAIGQPMSYSFIDNNPVMGVNYYRLKLKDASGKYTYSRIVTVIKRSSLGLTVSAYPNPTINTLTIMTNGSRGKNSTISITDIAGRNIQTLIVNNDRIEVNTTALKAGIYFVKYVDENETKIIKIIKQQ